MGEFLIFELLPLFCQSLFRSSVVLSGCHKIISRAKGVLSTGCDVGELTPNSWQLQSQNVQ